MKGLLDRRGFDVAGVMKEDRGPVVGFVLAEELHDGIVGDHSKPLSAEHLISDATPIADLLKILGTKERSFVLVGPEVKGIVTLADLNKPPIRVYLFGLVSLLEMHLRFWTKKGYPGDSWKEHLKDKRLEYANKIQAERKKRDQQIELVDCLQFCDLSDLLLRKKELRSKLGIESKGKGDELLSAAEKLRDLLAHSQQDLGEGNSWLELIGLIDQIEASIHRSDDAVEHEARLSTRNGPSLWTVTQ